MSSFLILHSLIAEGRMFYLPDYLAVISNHGAHQITKHPCLNLASTCGDSNSLSGMPESVYVVSSLK